MLALDFIQAVAKCIQKILVEVNDGAIWCELDYSLGPVDGGHHTLEVRRPVRSSFILLVSHVVIPV